MSTSNSSTCHRSSYSPPTQRYKVVFINDTNINPLWEGYAIDEREAKIKATLWVERVYIKLNISEVICERTT